MVFSDDDCRDGVREVAAVLAESEAAWLGLVADLDTRPGAVHGAAAGKVAHCFLAGGLNRTPGQARRDVEAATAPIAASDGSAAVLPAAAAAFAAGATTRDHVGCMRRHGGDAAAAGA